MIPLLALTLAFQAAQPLPGPTRAAEAEQLAQAELRYRSSIALSPTISAYHESLALVLEREGRLEDALASHREAVRLDSLTFRNRAGFGHLLLRLGRPAEAIPQLRAAAVIDRTSIDARKELAIALEQQSRHEEALSVLREARELDSTDREVAQALEREQPTRAVVMTASNDHPVVRGARRALGVLFGVLLGASALVVLAPMAGALVLGIRGAAGSLRRAPA